MTAICGMCPWYVCASWQSFLCIFYATFLFISLLRYFCFVFHSTFLPPAVLTKWWMKEYELWMLNGVNGQKKKNNGKCWTKTWTVDGIQVIRSGSGGGKRLRLILKARNTNASGQVNCGFYYSLRIIYPSDTPPFQYEPTQMIFEPFSICSALRKQEVV